MVGADGLEGMFAALAMEAVLRSVTVESAFIAEEKVGLGVDFRIAAVSNVVSWGPFEDCAVAMLLSILEHDQGSWEPVRESRTVSFRELPHRRTG